jgi:hypothetical protein
MGLEQDFSGNHDSAQLMLSVVGWNVGWHLAP